MQIQGQVEKSHIKRRDLAEIILRNTLVMTIAGWALKVANFGYMIVVIRMLGDRGFGQYATVLTFERHAVLDPQCDHGSDRTALSKTERHYETVILTSSEI
ncbi:MAG: hypothetical protein AB4911_11295 [Oscillochloridaceae bacterium umkhey_bin13]